MIQSGERLRAHARDSFAAIVRYRLALLWIEVRLGSPALASVGLISLALALQTVVLNSPGHFRPSTSPFFTAIVVAGTAGSLASCWLAAYPLRRLLQLRVRQFLALGAIVSLSVLSVIGVGHTVSALSTLVQGTPYSNDGAVFDLYAAQQVRHGHNPYIKTNIVAALAAINAPAITTTPLMDGQFRGLRAYPSETAQQQAFMNDLRYRPRKIPPEFESKYNYPSGSFLFILPFVLLGLHDMRFLYALAILAIGVYLWHRLPRALRPLAPLLLLADVPLIVLTSGGQPDPLYGIFLLLAYAEWASPWLSPLSMGLAVGTKQLAWFFLPFYFILIIRQYGWREGLRRSAIITAVFLLLNGPFILWSPISYVTSLAGPMSDPMFPLGVGIIALFVSNLLPLLPKVAFTVMEAVTWFSGVAASWNFRRLPAATGLVLGALPLFFAWRSLVNYFYLVPLLALAVILADGAQRRRV